jgi:hypothetical protein
MSLDVTGKLINLLPVESGQGKNGPWTKQPFIIETEDQYPKKICISAWNDSAKNIQAVPAGTKVKVSISIESREYNGRWYTDIRSWKIETSGNQVDRPVSGFSSASQPIEPMQAEMQQEDDLPF